MSGILGWTMGSLATVSASHLLEAALISGVPTAFISLRFWRLEIRERADGACEAIRA